MGTFATFLATVCMYKTRNIRLKGVPVLSALMPAIFNSIIIGLEIEIFFIEGPFNFMSFLTQAGLVAFGELVVLFTLGLIFEKTLRSKNFEKYLNNI